MSLNDIERRTHEKALSAFLERRRPPAHLRAQVDLGYAMQGQTIDLFEVRPDWRDGSVVRQLPVARLRFVRTDKQWRLYWRRQSGKWQLYDPSPLHRTLPSALEAVEIDAYGCFWG